VIANTVYTEVKAMYYKALIVILLSAFAIFQSFAEAQMVKDGLVSYWNLDKATIDGAKVKDTVGKNDGDMKGEPKLVEGKVGNALEFNGASDYVEIPTDDSMNFGTGDFTICVWAKTKATTGRWAQRQDIAGKGDPSVSGYAISADTNKGFFWVGAAGEFSGTTDINDNEWHHIVGVRRAADCFIYTDGKQEAKGTNAESVDTTVSMIFAKHPLKAESFFAGSIDEVCIYNRALTDDEILKNFGSKGESVSNTGKLSSVWGAMKSSAL